MYCKNCGTLVDDNAFFCSKCGTAMTPAAGNPYEPPAGNPYGPPPGYPYGPPAGAPYYPPYGVPYGANPYAPYEPEPPEPYQDPTVEKSILTKGIVGLALSILPVAGFVVSKSGKNAYNTYVNKGGIVTGKAKTGRILANIGFPVGIVATVVWGILFLAFL